MHFASNYWHLKNEIMDLIEFCPIWINKVPSFFFIFRRQFVLECRLYINHEILLNENLYFIQNVITKILQKNSILSVCHHLTIYVIMIYPPLIMCAVELNYLKHNN